VSTTHFSTPLSKASAAVGRPRGFVPEEALRSALAVLWRKGYEATSLDDLTAAMGLSRSSFYGCFGSKRAVLMAAVEVYADDCFAEATAVAEAQSDPVAAVRAVLAAIANIGGGLRGCFFVNSVTELAPHDPELAAYGQGHIARVSGLVAGLLVRAGFPASLAEDRAGAALALAMGAITLRKAGIPAARIQVLLDQAQMLLALPPERG